jgi:hypothetical protein
MTTAWGEPQLWGGSEGSVWKLILGEARKVIENALGREGINIGGCDVAEFRWDVPDVTFSWPKYEGDGHQYRNIHVWLEGRWPSYSLHVECATWLDGGSGRRIRFIHPTSLAVRVEGKVERPDSVEFTGDLPDTLKKMISAVSEASSGEGEVYPLEAWPE